MTEDDLDDLKADIERAYEGKPAQYEWHSSRLNLILTRIELKFRDESHLAEIQGLLVSAITAIHEFHHCKRPSCGVCEAITGAGIGIWAVDPKSEATKALKAIIDSRKKKL